MANEPTRRSVGVVGAGISGLSLVRALEQRGVDIVAFEAENDPGGVMRSRTVDGRVIELGPQRLRLTPHVRSLVDELDLGEELFLGNDGLPLYIYYEGACRVAPLSLREALTTDLLGPLGKVRVLLEPLTGPPRDGETVEECLTRKFGRQAASRFAGPLYSGLYGTDPSEMYVRYSLGRALDAAGVDRSVLLWVLRRLLRGDGPPPICSFEDGLGRLAEAMYEAHADRIHLDTPVETIIPGNETTIQGNETTTQGNETATRGSDGEGGYDVVTTDGTWHVDDVVVTTPAGTAARLLDSVDAALATTLDRFEYNPIALVYLESEFDGEGIGVLVPGDQEPQISGMTWNASVLDRDGVYTCYLDPDSYPGLLDASDEELEAVASREFRRITGASAAPLYVHRWEPGMPAYDRSWTALDDLEPPPGIHFCSNFVDRPGIPGRLRHAERLASELADE